MGPPFRDRKSLETKQTQVKPNANRDWPIKNGQAHQTAANQIVPKFFLDPHLTKCIWGTPYRLLQSTVNPKIYAHGSILQFCSTIVCSD